MVCIPCFVVPVALLIWRFILWPLLRPLYIRWYGIPKEEADDNIAVEKLDKLGDDGCPFGCPIKPKLNNSLPIPNAEEKKVS